MNPCVRATHVLLLLCCHPQVVASLGVTGEHWQSQSLLGSFLRGTDGERRTYVKKKGDTPMPYSKASLKQWTWVFHHLWEQEAKWRCSGDAMEASSGQSRETNPTDEPKKVITQPYSPDHSALQPSPSPAGLPVPFLFFFMQVQKCHVRLRGGFWDVHP